MNRIFPALWRMGNASAADEHGQIKRTGFLPPVLISIPWTKDCFIKFQKISEVHWIVLQKHNLLTSEYIVRRSKKKYAAIFKKFLVKGAPACRTGFFAK